MADLVRDFSEVGTDFCSFFDLVFDLRSGERRGFRG